MGKTTNLKNMKTHMPAEKESDTRQKKVKIIISIWKKLICVNRYRMYLLLYTELLKLLFISWLLSQVFGCHTLWSTSGSYS